MRAILIALIGMLSFTCIALSQSNLSAQSKVQEGQAKKTGRLPQPPPSIVIQCDAQCGHAAINQAPKAIDALHRAHDWIDRLNAWSTATIAVFTILLFSGIFYQVQNLRDVERAWFVMEQLVAPEELEHFSLAKPTPIKAQFTFRNCGRTPAKITKSSFFFGLVDKASGLPEVPQYRPEDATSGYPKQGLLVVQSETSNISVEFMDGKEDFEPSQLVEIRDGKSLLVIYGFILYSDAFRRRHELRFCHIYHPKKGVNNWMGGEFKLEGPISYNSHT
jgi:hypothetical protein